MNRAATFKQADICRALKGAAAAGHEVGRVEIDPSGKIVMVFARKGAVGDSRPNEWDEVLDAPG